MNIDLIAAVMTILTMYSTFITIKYIQTRQHYRRLKMKLAMQELANACDDMAALFEGMAEESKRREDAKEELDGHKSK